LTVSAPPARASSPALPGGYSILEAKLRPPTWRQGLIGRPRLVARLDARTDVPLIVLLAPAGYGKSTLLAEWTTRIERPSIWLHLDERDNDPAVLLGYVAVALARFAGLEDAAYAAAVASGPSVWAVAVPSIGSALARLTTPFVLVFDELEHVTSQESLDVIVALAAHLPAGAQFALATRTADRLPIARLLAADRATLVERDVLELDDEEAADLLALAGSRRSAEQVRALNAVAEGWAAGLYLTALAARSQTSADRPTPLPADDRRLVADYLRSEVLDRLPPEDVRFLIRTATLDRLNASLCDHVLETSTSAATLDALERSNLLLIPLDPARHWFRYHSLLREFLADELTRREPDVVGELNRRASEWYEETGDADAALFYAVAAGDVPRVSRLLPPLAQRAYNAGRTETVRTWFEWLEAREGPDLASTTAGFGAVFFAFIGEAGRAEQWTDLARAAIAPGNRLDEAVARYAESIICRSGVSTMRLDAEQAVEDFPPAHFFRPAAHILAAIAQELEGRADEADPRLADGIDLALAQPWAKTAATIGLVHRATYAIRRSAWAEAEQLAHQARAIVVDSGLVDQVAGLVVDSITTRIAAHHGAVTQARTDLAHAQRLRPMLNHAIPWLAVRVRLNLATTHLALGDPGGARVLMSEIDDIIRRRPGLGTLEGEARELGRRLDAARGIVSGSSTLTMAELRLLPLLATHLTFPDIADRMILSANTVKTQAKSIYRKLEASSRTEAVERARELGLLEGSAPLDRLYLDAG
jgi:LuxR family maltose regulon positive regulatory protein